MHNAWLVVQREYLERIRSKAFIIMTLLMPVFMASTILIPTLLSNMKSGVTRRIVLVANNPEIAVAIQQQLTPPPGKSDNSGQPQPGSDGSTHKSEAHGSSSKSIPIRPTPSATNFVTTFPAARSTASSG